MLRKFCIINTCGSEDCGNHQQDHAHGAYYLVQDVDPLRARLVEAETALLNAMMGNVNSVAAYLTKYPDPYSVS